MGFCVKVRCVRLVQLIACINSRCIYLARQCFWFSLLIHSDTFVCLFVLFFFFFQGEDGIRDLVRSRGLGDVYKRQLPDNTITLRNFDGRGQSGQVTVSSFNQSFARNMAELNQESWPWLNFNNLQLTVPRISFESGTINSR